MLLFNPQDNTLKTFPIDDADWESAIYVESLVSPYVGTGSSPAVQSRRFEAEFLNFVCGNGLYSKCLRISFQQLWLVLYQDCNVDSYM